MIKGFRRYNVSPLRDGSNAYLHSRVNVDDRSSFGGCSRRQADVKMDNSDGRLMTAVSNTHM